MKRLAGQITTTKKFLTQTGTGAISADPVWNTLDASDIPAHNHAGSDINSGSLDGDRLPGLSTTKKGGVPATGTPSGKYLKDDGTWDTPTSAGWQTSYSEASATGTAIDVSSIPSWVKRITISFSGVSTNGTSNILIQIGDSGGLETTGYASNSSVLGASSYTGTSSTAGFAIYYDNSSRTYSGALVLTLVDSTNHVWAASGVLAATDALTYAVHSAGIKTLSATLDRLRITTVILRELVNKNEADAAKAPEQAEPQPGTNN